jgi:alpha-L-fucosidase 2
MQSKGDQILLLPALPQAWVAGSITGLRARGGCPVALRCSAGRLTAATIRAAAPVTRMLRLGGRTKTASIAPGKPLRLTPSFFA